LPPVLDARPDLELSQDSEAEEIDGVRIIDLDADLDAEKPFIEFSDVEPDYTAEELAARAQAVTTPAIATPTLPEIVFDFQEAVVISDDETPSTSVVSTTVPSKPSATSLADVAPTIATTDVITTATSTTVATTSSYKISVLSPTLVTTPLTKAAVIVVSTSTTTVATTILTAPTTTTAAATCEPSTSKTVVTS